MEIQSTQQSFSLTLPEQLLPSDERLIAEAEEEWSVQAKNPEFKKQLRNLVAGIRGQISLMRKLNSGDMKNEIQRIIKDFHVSANFFYRTSASYFEEKQTQEICNKKFRASIRNTKIDMTPFASKKPENTSFQEYFPFDNTPTKDIQQEKMSQLSQEKR